MKTKWLWQAVVDGLLNSGYYIILQWFVVSVLFHYVIEDERVFIFICLFGAIVNSIVYYKLLSKNKSVKEHFYLTFVSMLVFVVCMLMRFTFMLVVPIRLFQRELCNAHGILMFLSALIFLVSTIVLRLFILIYEIFRVRKATDNE